MHQSMNCARLTEGTIAGHELVFSEWITIIGFINSKWNMPPCNISCFHFLTFFCERSGVSEGNECGLHVNAWQCPSFGRTALWCGVIVMVPLPRWKPREGIVFFPLWWQYTGNPEQWSTGKGCVFQLPLQSWSLSTPLMTQGLNTIYPSVTGTSTTLPEATSFILTRCMGHCWNCSVLQNSKFLISISQSDNEITWTKFEVIGYPY